MQLILLVLLSYFCCVKSLQTNQLREQANAARYVFIYSIVNVVMWYQLGSNKSEHPIPFPMWPFGASLLFGASVPAVSVVSSAELSLPITKGGKK